MTSHLPPGVRLLTFEALDSTNAEALRRAEKGEPCPLWIVAKQQNKGRGRSGRSWVSPPGNLYASLLLELGEPLETALELSFVAALSAFSTLEALLQPRGLKGDLQLKWPNDILLDGKKIAGILLESAPCRPFKKTEEAFDIVIGTGINLCSHPCDTLLPATHLSDHGAEISPSAGFQELAFNTDKWLKTWDKGRGFEPIREAWMSRAHKLGERLFVRLHDKNYEGVFSGLDPKGALLLTLENGEEKHIRAGDVFLPAHTVILKQS